MNARKRCFLANFVANSVQYLHCEVLTTDEIDLQGYRQFVLTLEEKTACWGTLHYWLPPCCSVGKLASRYSPLRHWPGCNSELAYSYYLTLHGNNDVFFSKKASFSPNFQQTKTGSRSSRQSNVSRFGTCYK